MDIGKRIREQAKSHHIKLAEIANQLDINPTNFARLIDSDNIRVKDLYQIVDIIGCNITDLLGIPTYQVTAENSTINIIVKKKD